MASDLIDAALVDVLRDDATLAALLPDGVYLDEAPPGRDRFVIVSLAESLDEREFQDRAFESGLYLVEAVVRGTDGHTAAAAAARIDVLLEGGTLTFAASPAPPYALAMLAREGRRTPEVEVDEADPSIRWQHRGGYYRVIVTTAA